MLNLVLSCPTRRPSGKFGYTRQYVMYNNAPGHATLLDEEAMVFVRQHPDSVGNCNSALATVVRLALKHNARTRYLTPPLRLAV